MRDPLATWVLKPSRFDVERLNAIRAGPVRTEQR